MNLDRPADPPLVMEGSAAAIWGELLDDNGVPVPAAYASQIAETLSSVYGTESDVIADDVRAFLEQMQGMGFVHQLWDSPLRADAGD